MSKLKAKKDKKNIVFGKVYIVSTFNNTIISFTDSQGNLISWSSSGSNGFKGAKKSTPYAAQITAQKAGEKALVHGLKEVDIIVNGPGSGRESAVRTIDSLGIKIKSIRDKTPLPHNGCRPRKRRRV